MLQAKLSFREKPMLSEEPLSARTVFTVKSKKTHKSVIVWLNQHHTRLLLSVRAAVHCSNGLQKCIRADPSTPLVEAEL